MAWGLFGVLYIGLRLCRPDWCRDHSRGFTRPVFPALGTSVRLAAPSVFLLPPQLPPLPSPLSPYTTGLLQGVKCHPLEIPRLLLSLLSLMIGVYVCKKERERERNRAREGNLRVCTSRLERAFLWFSEGVWGDRGWVRDRSPHLGAIKIAITAREITACLLDTSHLY